MSLFAGIGGIDLALEQLGVRSVAFCDWEPYCQKVLSARWPGVPVFGDVKDLSVTELADKDIDINQIQMVTGGFPCQPHSISGLRKAKSDERHLWPEMARVLKEVEPAYILAENVDGLLSSANGEVLGDVLCDLADMGYAVGWSCYAASHTGCMHERYRVFSFGIKPDEPVWMPDRKIVSEQIVGWLTYSRWPALAGCFQRAFEPARVVFSDPDKDRSSRIKAIGNAVSPHQVFPMVVALLCRGDSSYLDFSDTADEWLEACAMSRMFESKLLTLESCFALVRDTLARAPGKQFAHRVNQTWYLGAKPYIGASTVPLVTKWRKHGRLTGKQSCVAFEPSVRPTDTLLGQFPPQRGDDSLGAVLWCDMDGALWRTPTGECGVKPEQLIDKEGRPPSKLGVTIYRRNKDGTVAKQSVTLNQQVEMCHNWEVALWATPAANTTAGELPEHLVNRFGQEPKPGEKLYRRESGRVVQTALSTQVKMWPGEWGEAHDPHKMGLGHLWSVPSDGEVADNLGCPERTIKQGPAIDRTQKTDRGTRAMANPDWQEILMGFPPGWTKLNVPER
ncbi:MAG: DNA (cytosine-5-)-methyltransferase [Armatimonadetes bacterium]|nr:DNA (cytosine-5-)-methyltransferase [Armatimonadota bacterium]